ncbi:hypothetical protein AB0I94_25515 [Streptomyces sp. NPDC050147]|uniref:hypothetical protein n=1 Tax=Streptomyces sp. NPDC050147 TaxID=3155513 RepID=UPI00343E85DC
MLAGGSAGVLGDLLAVDASWPCAWDRATGSVRLVGPQTEAEKSGVQIACRPRRLLERTTVGNRAALSKDRCTCT